MSLLEDSTPQQKRIDFCNEPYIHFEIQGRLGNQLFGLSDAHSLGRHFNRKVLLDISSVTSEYGKPEWLEYAQEWRWAEVVEIEVVHLESQSVNKVNVGLTDPLIQKPNSHFHGFNPDVESVESSGLFFRGVFPFGEKNHSRADSNQIALCVRRGDYHQNPHLGILPAVYYKKALAKLLPENSKSKIVVFCDSEEETTGFLDTNHIPYNEFDGHLNALDALRNLSQCSQIIAANSTFSFWGSFFSQATSCFPYPFYISDPKWGLKLSKGSNLITFMRFPRVNYFFQLIFRKFGS